MSSIATNQLSNPTSTAPAVHPGTRRALILAGGGAQGAYEVGIIKAMLAGKSPGTASTIPDFDVVAGTSVGSVNASLILSTYDQGPSAIASILEQVWTNDIADAPGRCNSAAFRIRGNPLNFLSRGCYSPSPLTPFIQLAQDGVAIGGELFKRTLNLFTGREKLDQRALELLNIGVLVSNDPLKNLLTKTIRLDKIRSARPKLRIAATNWAKGEVRFFANADMTDEKGIQIIMASSGIPAVYPPVEIDGDPYVDGGVLMNTPLNPAIEAGANELHIIYMQPDAQNFPLPSLQNTVHDVYRSLVLGYGAAVVQDIETARKVNDAIGFLQGEKNIEEASSKSGVLVAAARQLSARGTLHCPLTVHRYHPFGNPGVGWLSFGLEDIQHLLELGYNDAVKHDCDKNECLIA